MSNSRLPSVSSNEGRAESEREYLELPPHLSTSSQLGSQNPRLAIVQRSSSPPYISPYPLIDQNTGQLPPSHILRSNHSPSPGPSSSGHPSSSQSATAASFAFTSPTVRPSTLDSPGTMGSSKPMTQSEKTNLTSALNARLYNTLVDLRRAERSLVTARTSDVTESLTSAWAHYVNSNNLLSELRALTKSYPFASECLDEAKWSVISDVQSSRSWNYAWLVLLKMRNAALIPKHARLLASKPSMWGGKTPTSAQTQQLTTACMNEWTLAVAQLLRHWEVPPTITGT